MRLYHTKKSVFGCLFAVLAALAAVAGLSVFGGSKQAKAEEIALSSIAQQIDGNGNWQYLDITFDRSFGYAEFGAAPESPTDTRRDYIFLDGTSYAEHEYARYVNFEPDGREGVLRIWFSYDIKKRESHIFKLAEGLTFPDQTMLSRDILISYHVSDPTNDNDPPVVSVQEISDRMYLIGAQRTANANWKGYPSQYYDIRLNGPVDLQSRWEIVPGDQNPLGEHIYINGRAFNDEDSFASGLQVQDGGERGLLRLFIKDEFLAVICKTADSNYPDAVREGEGAFKDAASGFLEIKVSKDIPFPIKNYGVTIKDDIILRADNMDGVFSSPDFYKNSRIDSFINDYNFVGWGPSERNGVWYFSFLFEDAFKETNGWVTGSGSPLDGKVFINGIDFAAGQNDSACHQIEVNKDGTPGRIMFYIYRDIWDIDDLLTITFKKDVNIFGLFFTDDLTVYTYNQGKGFGGNWSWINGTYEPDEISHTFAPADDLLEVDHGTMYEFRFPFSGPLGVMSANCEDYKNAFGDLLLINGTPANELRFTPEGGGEKAAVFQIQSDQPNEGHCLKLVVEKEYWEKKWSANEANVITIPKNTFKSGNYLSQDLVIYSYNRYGTKTYMTTAPEALEIRSLPADFGGNGNWQYIDLELTGPVGTIEFAKTDDLDLGKSVYIDGIGFYAHTETRHMNFAPDELANTVRLWVTYEFPIGTAHYFRIKKDIVLVNGNYLAEDLYFYFDGSVWYEGLPPLAVASKDIRVGEADAKAVYLIDHVFTLGLDGALANTAAALSPYVSLNGVPLETFAQQNDCYVSASYSDARLTVAVEKEYLDAVRNLKLSLSSELPFEGGETFGADLAVGINVGIGAEGAYRFYDISSRELTVSGGLSVVSVENISEITVGETSYGYQFVIGFNRPVIAATKNYMAADIAYQRLDGFEGAAYGAAEKEIVDFYLTHGLRESLLDGITVDGSSLNEWLAYVTENAPGIDKAYERNLALQVMYGPGGDTSKISVKFNLKNIDRDFDTAADHTLKISAGFTGLSGAKTDADSTWTYYRQLPGSKWSDTVPPLIVTDFETDKNGRNVSYIMTTMFDFDSADELGAYIRINGVAPEPAVSVSVQSGKIVLTAAESYAVTRIVLLSGLTAASGGALADDVHFVYSAYDDMWVYGVLNVPPLFVELSLTDIELKTDTRDEIVLTFDRNVTAVYAQNIAGKGVDDESGATEILLKTLILNGYRDEFFDKIFVGGKALRAYLEDSADVKLSLGGESNRNTMTLSFEQGVLDLSKNLWLSVEAGFRVYTQSEIKSRVDRTFVTADNEWQIGLIDDPAPPIDPAPGDGDDDDNAPIGGGGEDNSKDESDGGDTTIDTSGCGSYAGVIYPALMPLMLCLAFVGIRLFKRKRVD